MSVRATLPADLSQPAIGAAAGIVEGGEVQVAGSAWRLAAYVFLENKLAIVGLVYVVLMFLFCFVGPLIYRQDVIHTVISNITQPPSSAHVLGTDIVGKDVLALLMVGGQTSLEIGIAAAGIALALGVVWGAVAGFIGGWVDQLMMRIVDSLLSIPTLFLLLVLAALAAGQAQELSLIHI